MVKIILKIKLRQKEDMDEFPDINWKDIAIKMINQWLLDEGVKEVELYKKDMKMFSDLFNRRYVYSMHRVDPITGYVNFVLDISSNLKRKMNSKKNVNWNAVIYTGIEITLNKLKGLTK